MTTDRILRASQDSWLADKPPSAAQNAALRGASLAWKPPVKPKPNINTYAPSDGALAAATKVGGGRNERATQNDRYTTPVKPSNTGDSTRLGYQITGDSVGMGSLSSKGSARISPSRARMGRLDSSGFLQPSGFSVEQRQSPSFIAATLAASRSASVSPNVTGPQKISRPNLKPRSDYIRSPSTRRSSSRESSDHPLDTTSIPPTNSLIGIFEQNTRSQDTGRRAPKKNTVAQVQARAPTPPPSKKQRQPTPRKLRTPSPSPIRPRSEQLTPKGPTSLPAPPPKKPERQSSKPVPIRAPEVVTKSIPIPKPKTKPQAPLPLAVTSLPSETGGLKHEYGSEGSSSDDSFVSATDNRPTPPPRRTTVTPQRQRLTSASMTSINSLNTINSMANAIVASSLATSRANSPSKQLLAPPPPPPSRRNGRTHLFHSTHNDISRTPSPSKPGALRTTMRKPRLEEEVDEGDKRRSKKHIMKKHPNKHAEGDRKRWRDEITEREKKRYEGVFASNRGLYLQGHPGAENLVCNLVVRDIFSRSRLHSDVLEEVYALVDKSQNGALEKEEFVVGLWLIDQRLKGRKLPIRVSDHVWRSVGSLKWIKVRKA